MAWTLGPSALACALLLCAQRVVCSQTQPLKLELASVVFRHGDRSPVRAYPKDPCNECYWPQGLGQLSIKGMQQEYFLGGVFRDRYVAKALIASNYTRVQVYVRSTDYDRTLMSAESLLAALFPPDDNQEFNSSIPWQPIPVHTVPQEDDRLLRAYALDCPRYSALREDDQKSAEYKKIEEENKAFLSRIENVTGFVPTTMENVWIIQDILLVQNLSGIPFPCWLEEGDWQRLTELATYTFNLMFSSTEKSRLTAGNWVRKVVDDMKTKKENSKEDIKLYLYSAHDTTVAAMASALGVYNGILPPYSAALIIELYSDATGLYWVSMFYRNETNSRYLMPLSVASCANTTLCTLEEFINHAAPVLPDDWESECGLTGHNDGGSNTNIAAIVLGILLCVTILSLVVLTVLLLIGCRNRRKTPVTELDTLDDELL